MPRTILSYFDERIAPLTCFSKHELRIGHFVQLSSFFPENRYNWSYFEKITFAVLRRKLKIYWHHHICMYGNGSGCQAFQPQEHN